MSDTALLTSIGQRIISELEMPIHFQHKFYQVSASIGTVFNSMDSSLTAKQLFENADIVLYASKKMGRAQQKFFTEDLKALAWADVGTAVQQ